MAVDLFVDNDMEVTVSDLRDQDGNAITGATVEVTVYDSQGAEVSGQSWPLTLSDDGGGEYSGILESDVDLTFASIYTVEVIATKGSATNTWREDITAKQRRFNQ